MLTVSLLVCAVMALTRAAAVAEAEPGERTGPLIQEVKSHMVKRYSLCPSDWTDSSGRCVLYFPLSKTWSNAERYCQDYGGNLASVHNLNDQQFIQSVILSITEKYPEAWLGGYDAQQEGTWFWSDGTPFKFDYWDKGQPDNNRGTGHCLVMNYSARRKFDDQPCYVAKPFVCARKP
ncbi:ladderlectin-like isoform X4 [Sebastes umbrosus]|uniref:ladderlectin-like isoform X4 n=1 Tax=Sebastes umbrosus TaxID=72105 RepID=UPI0018A0B680|nr:ladderlectin-like isoform X4 [Sebastes umbrosus]